MDSAATTQSASPGRRYLGHVEGLRALAALMVFLNHAYAQSYRGGLDHATGLLAPFSLSMIGGHLAVSVFIVISGFCLTLPVVDAKGELRGGTRAFFKRRARRILPPYYGALGLSLLLILTLIGNKTGTLWDVSNQIDWKAFVAHVALVQDLFRTGRINYVFWSIAVEWHIYFLFPLLLWGVRRVGVVRVTMAALLLGYAIRFGFDGDRIERANPQYLGLFALGMLAAYVTSSPETRFVRLRGSRWWSVLAACLLLLTTSLAARWGVAVGVTRFHYLDGLVGAMAMATLIHASSWPKSRLTRFLSRRSLVFVGTFSYSLYLVHAPLLQLLWQYVLHPLNLTASEMFLALVTFGLVTVLLSAYLFFRVFEEPFMRSSSRSTVRSPGAQPAI